VPIASTSMPPAVPFAKSGKVRPIAVMSSRRSPALPDVPTVAELGYKDFEANTWFALFAPGKTPAAALDLLNAEFNKALGARTVTERFTALSLEAQPMDRATLRRYVDSEGAKWGKLIKDIGIKPE
jgi:tripartite-type tricarboxylate transporter receptor subunit TctC